MTYVSPDSVAISATKTTKSISSNKESEKTSSLPATSTLPTTSYIDTSDAPKVRLYNFSCFPFVRINLEFCNHPFSCYYCFASSNHVSFSIAIFSQVPVTISILASTVVLTTPRSFGGKLNSFSPSNTNKRKLKGYERTPKKNHPSNTKQVNTEFIKKQLILRQNLKNNKTTEKERAKRDSEYSNFEPNDSQTFQKSTNSASQSSSWVRLKHSQSPISSIPSSPACSHVPRQKCKSVPKPSCSQVPKATVKNVCIPVQVSSPRQECATVPRTECEVIETAAVEESCTAVPSRLPAQKQCSFPVGRGIFYIW